MQEEVTLDLREFFWILKKRVKLIVSITLLSTIIAGVISFFVLSPVYQSKVSVVIGKTGDGKQNENYQYNEVMMYQKLVKTYAEIAKLQSVAEDTIEKANLNITPTQLKDIVKVTPQADTQILDITVEHKNPNKAKVIADIFTEEFIKKSTKAIQGGEVEILDPAQVPEKPIKPNKKLNIAIAFFLGLMVSIGLTFLLEYMDNTIKTDEDVLKSLEIPVIGVIPEHE